MAEFGQPQRTATTDANEGHVNPPTVKREARRGTSSRTSADSVRKAGLSRGLSSAGRTLGEGLAGMMDTRRANIKEQRALEAANRQGMDTAINTDDLNQKRTGWKKAVFGESVEYRAAQQRAIKNSLDKLYMTQAAEIDKYAGESPEDFAGRMQAGLDEVLDSYGDDTETRAMVANAYAQNSSKLVQKHYLAHQAFTQTENRRVFIEGVQTKLDTFVIESANFASPEEAAEAYETWGDIFDPSTRPEDMDEVAWRGTINEVINDNLRNGNFGAMNLSEHAGFKLTAAEQVERDQAVAVYDRLFSGKVARVQSEGDLAASKAVDIPSAVAALETAIEQMKTLEAKSSGTDAAQRALLNGEDSLVDYINRLRTTSSKAVAKAQREAELLESDMVQVQRDIMGMSANWSGRSKKDQETAMDSVMANTIKSLGGMDEEADNILVIDQALANPQIAREVAGMYARTSIRSPLIRGMIETGMNGVLENVNPETGRPTEDAITAFTSISQFQDEPKFAREIGNDNLARYHIIQRALEAGNTAEGMQEQLRSFFENRGKWDDFNIRYPRVGGDEGPRITRREHVQNVVKTVGGFHVDGAELNKMVEVWKDGVVIHGGEMEGGNKYLKRHIHGLGVRYRGQVIANSAHLNTISGGKDANYSLSQILDGMQDPDINLMTPFITHMFGGHVDPSNPTRTLDDINYRLYTKAGTDGVWLSSPEGQQDVHISMSAMESAARILRQHKERQKLEEEVIAKAVDQHLRTIIPHVPTN